MKNDTHTEGLATVSNMKGLKIAAKEKYKEIRIVGEFADKVRTDYSYELTNQLYPMRRMVVMGPCVPDPSILMVHTDIRMLLAHYRIKSYVQSELVLTRTEKNPQYTYEFVAKGIKSVMKKGNQFLKDIF